MLSMYYNQRHGTWFLHARERNHRQSLTQDQAADWFGRTIVVTPSRMLPLPRGGGWFGVRLGDSKVGWHRLDTKHLCVSLGVFWSGGRLDSGLLVWFM
jgi:hypothetical protein